MLKKSLIIATGITLTLFGIILYIGTLYGQYNPGDTSQYVPKNLGQGSRAFGYFFHEVGTTGTYIQYYGTQSVTGSGTAGRITGTSSALPHVEYNYAGGTPTFNFVGATLQNEGVDVAVSSDLGSYIAVSGGTGTGNTLTNTTLDGTGTISANVSLSGNITANSLLITPIELGYLNNASSEIQSQITTATGSITNHVHTGADGTPRIAHNSVTGTGTNSHTILDTFVASKAQASGLASLDSNSLVVENPASGTTTPTTSKIPIADGAGKIADGWLNSTVSLLGQTIALGTETTGNTDSIAEGDSNLYYLDSRVNAAIGSLSVNSHSDVNITFNENDFVKIVGGQLVAGSSSTTTDWANLIGLPEGNGSVSVSSGAGYIPVAGSDGKLDYGWQKNVIRLTGTTTEQAAGAFGQLYVQSSSSGSGAVGPATVLLLHFNETGSPTTFIDSSSYTATMVSNGNAVGTTTAKFGGAAWFDGASATSITTADNDRYTMGTSSVTVDYWVYLSNTGTSQGFWSQRQDASNEIYAVWYQPNGRFFPLSVVSGGVDKSGYYFVWSPSANTWYHMETVRSGTSVYHFVDGVAQSLTTVTAIGSYSIDNFAGDFKIGNSATLSAYLNGAMDEFRLAIGEARHTSGFIPPTFSYTGDYTQYSAKYADPVNGNTVFEILTPGTATTEQSYIYNNATTTVWGLGTNTAITSGTATGYYAGWTNRPIRVSAVDIASTKKIKENIMPIHIKPEQLEAESRAKPIYVAEKKPAWFTANEMNYTYVGSDTATYVDTTAMESAYASYIELEWATDLNQSVYIDAVQKAQQKYFWGLFDKIQPKSWNPIDDLRMTRKGLVVEDVPDEIKGADGQSIDQMAVTTYQTLVLQELKDSIVDIMQALKDLSSAGTFTTQAIVDRLEVMRTAP